MIAQTVRETTETAAGSAGKQDGGMTCLVGRTQAPKNPLWQPKPGCVWWDENKPQKTVEMSQLSLRLLEDHCGFG